MKALMKIQLFVAALLLVATATQAQELKCQVTVNAQKISGVDPSVFQTMQTALNEFMNTRSWTQDIFNAEEKIDCSILIFISESPSQDVYKGKMTIQSSRPVFNSSYASPIFNWVDNDCILTYQQNMELDFGTTQYNSNLTSILGFYAYLIIAMDYESFGKAGGAKYFALAEQVMNNVPTNAPDAQGWRPYDTQNGHNRYWLIHELQQSKYDIFKQALYDYHFAGLDNFYDKPELARKNIMNALDKLDKIYADNPTTILLTFFFGAKSDELVGIFSGADPDEKVKALAYLRRDDASNSGKYEKLSKQ